MGKLLLIFLLVLASIFAVVYFSIWVHNILNDREKIVSEKDIACENLSSGGCISSGPSISVSPSISPSASISPTTEKDDEDISPSPTISPSQEEPDYMYSSIANIPNYSGLSNIINSAHSSASSYSIINSAHSSASSYSQIYPGTRMYRPRPPWLQQGIGLSEEEVRNEIKRQVIEELEKEGRLKPSGNDLKPIDEKRRKRKIDAILEQKEEKE